MGRPFGKNEKLLRAHKLWRNGSALVVAAGKYCVRPVEVENYVPRPGRPAHLKKAYTAKALVQRGVDLLRSSEVKRKRIGRGAIAKKTKLTDRKVRSVLKNDKQIVFSTCQPGRTQKRVTHITTDFLVQRTRTIDRRCHIIMLERIGPAKDRPIAWLKKESKACREGA